MTKHILLKKRARLDRAKSQLKAEFFGIDAVTVQLVDATSSWYLTPELQDLLMVVNLRGLTGVDKTSLVMRLAEELGITNDTYYFDLGEKQDGNNPVQTDISRMKYRGSGRVNLIILDEFQHARQRGSRAVEKDLRHRRVSHFR
jgi:hypothetical protein